MSSLPVAAVLPELLTALDCAPQVLLSAPTGAGKSTWLPLQLLAHPGINGKIILLEPRRLAARNVAQRLAELLNEKPGDTVGYRMRAQNCVGPNTRLEVVTEGVLTRMIQRDPELSGVGLVILDEFHERSLQADLALALLLDVQQGLRDDLKLLIMSATLDNDRLQQMLPEAPVVISEGRSFPVERRYLPLPAHQRFDDAVAVATAEMLRQESGSLLLFLPGVGEIQRVQEQLASRIGSDVLLCPLYGALSLNDQRKAILPAPQGMRKVVLATNIAETSLTIEGIRLVVDCAQERVARFDPRTGLTRLITQRVSQASMTQRAGRAGRLEPGISLHLIAKEQAERAGSLAKPATYLTALSQPKIYRLNTWIADAPIALRQPNGQVWSPQNDDRRYSESGRVMLVDALTRSMNVPTVNLGMALGLPAVTETWIKLGVPKDQLHPVPAMLLGALNLTPIEVAQAFQTIASGGNRAPLSALRSVIAEDGKVLYQSFPQAERAVPAQAAYLTLWTMQQVVQRGTGRQLGAKYPNLHLAGKTGTTNNNVDTWFAGIDGSTVTITWVGRDNNQPTKLYGASGAMSIYQRYLANQTPTPLNLVPPEDIADMGVDYDGNFVCSGGMRILPVWTSDPQSLCQQSEMQQQPSGNPFDQSSQPQQQPQQQPAQQEQKDSDGVAGWIKDMFGSN